MRYDPARHHRRSMRLKGYDYGAAGAYFITICTYQRHCLFGEIIDGEMHLNEFGRVVADCWDAIPGHFPSIQLDESVVMPNHVHGILVVTDTPRRGMALPCPYPTMPRTETREFGKPLAQTISTVVGSFKSAVTKRINILRNAPRTPVWQRNFYDHIIRHEASMQRIQHYVQTNPSSWRSDQLHPNVSSKW